MVTVAALIIIVSFVWFIFASVSEGNRQRAELAAALIYEAREREARQAAEERQRARERAENDAAVLGSHRLVAEQARIARKMVAEQVRAIRAGDLLHATPQARTQRAQLLAEADAIERGIPDRFRADPIIRGCLDAIDVEDLVEPEAPDTAALARRDEETLKQAMEMALALNDPSNRRRRA